MAEYIYVTEPADILQNLTLTINGSTEATEGETQLKFDPRINCSNELPASETFLTEVLAWHDPDIAFIVICTFCALIAIPIFLDEFFYVWRKYTSTRRKVLTVWMLGIYPVFSLTALLSVLIPRGALTCDFVASIYYSIAQYEFVQLLLNYMGGESKAIDRLDTKDDKMKLQTGPCCCCCCCLPTAIVSKKNLFKINVLVLQSPLLHILLLFLATLLWNDGSHDPGGFSMDNGQFWISSLVGTSKVIGLYGINILLTGVRKPLDGFQPMGKFAVFPFVLCFSRLQSFIINIMATTRIIPCKPPLSAAGRAVAIHNTLLATEVFLLAIWGRWLYRRRLPDGNDVHDDGDENEKLESVELEKLTVS